MSSFCLVLALLSCGISFFGPYWLGGVTSPRPGRDTQRVEHDLTYIAKTQLPSKFSSRGLWAQCYAECQWFWQYNYRLQAQKLTPLRWHLATQVLYFIGASLVLLCEFYSRAQLCCTQRKSVYRTLGGLLVVAFLLQTAAVSVFGGFAHYEYGAAAYKLSSSYMYTYLDWCFWMAVAGAGFTLLAATFFLSIDCVGSLHSK